MNKENPHKQKMLDLRQQGLSYGAISKLVGISRARVHQICSGYYPPSTRGVKKTIIYNSIFSRDNYVCQWCGASKHEGYEGKLSIHHIDFNDRNNASTNLITVCNACHLDFHSKHHPDPKIKSHLARPSDDFLP